MQDKEVIASKRLPLGGEAVRRGTKIEKAYMNISA